MDHQEKKCFEWKHGRLEKPISIQRLTRYHQEVRRDIHYIQGASRLWYFKRGGMSADVIQRSTLTMTFAAMHRLSEMARYEPVVLVRHFERRHNWVLSEFLKTALYQFADEIASEITGQDFMMPGRKFIS